jgi:ATP-dependent DNA helicase RecQ
MEAHLKSTYGFNDFRDYQKDIICDILKNENVFAILPTGGGKSLLYQFPATYNNKITIVVSPLISLMNDQCMFLNSKNIKSVCLNSEARTDVSSLGDCKIIYTTPEFITNRMLVLDKLKDNIGLFAIDEAHCVSQWSHDFRTSYLELGIIKKMFPKIPMLAVTATATPRVVDDMYDLLGIEEACEYNLGTRRTNLEINIHPKRLFNNYKFTEPTIIYVQTRKVCEELCEKLLITGTRACYYHGGMDKNLKQLSHNKFASGEIKVIVATISFGMGIDKSDIRHVINYGVPSDIETYYQEIGRAGRDGLPSKATLYYNDGDFATTQFLINQSSDSKQIALKMEAMNTFRKFLSENNMCRQQVIDYYFEKGSYPTEENVDHIPKCNMCDNCKGDKRQKVADISEETKTIVNIINTHLKVKGFTFGMVKTGDLIKKNPLFKLHSKLYIKELLEILITKNVLKRVHKGNNSVICVRKTEKELSEMMPITARVNSDISVDFKNKSSIDKNLERLYEIRKTIASKYGILPTMFINDKVLMNIHSSKPKDVSQLWKVDGISDEFIMKYGSEFIGEYKKKTNKKSSTSKSGGVKDITYKHYKEGRSINEISKLTGRGIQIIEDHMIHIFEHYDGVDIDPDYFGLTEEFEEEIKNAVKKVGSEFLKPIKDIVNNKITYGQIKLYLLISRLE